MDPIAYFIRFTIKILRFLFPSMSSRRLSRNISLESSFSSQKYIDDPIYQERMMNKLDAHDVKKVKAVGLLDMGNFVFGSKSYEIRKGVNTYFPHLLAKILEEEGCIKIID